MTEIEQDDNASVEAIEAEARKGGWSPRENWRGRPEEFVEADEFVRRGRQILPIVRAQFDKTRTENEQLKRDLAESRADADRRIKAVERTAHAALDLQRTQMLSDFESRKRAAAAAGDTATYDRVAADEQRAYAKLAEKTKPDPETPQSAATTVPPEVAAWAQRNPWFHRDPALAREAEGVHMALLEEAPGMSLADNLDRVAETLKSRYPQKFGVTAEQKGRTFSAVEGTTSTRGGSAPRERGWKELPSDAKDACQSMIDRGYLKGDLKKVQTDFAKTYWEEYND